MKCTQGPCQKKRRVAKVLCVQNDENRGDAEDTSEDSTGKNVYFEASKQQ